VEAFSPNDSEESGWTILGYRLRYKLDDAFVYTVTGLESDSVYLFIVRAENLEGLSPASLVSDPIRTAKGGARLSNVEDIRSRLATSGVNIVSVEPAGSTAVRVNWEVSCEF